MCCAVLSCIFRCATWGLVKALEKEAALYSDMLKGLQPQPPSEQWPSLDQRYQQLQERVQQQDESVQPGQLEQTLSSGLQPSQVGRGSLADHYVQCFAQGSRINQD